MTPYLFGEGSFPAEPFFLKVIANNDPPPGLDLVKTIPVSSPGLKLIATQKAGVVGENRALGLRSFQTSFESGLAFTSAVENVKRNDLTVRHWTNNVAADLMFAPIPDRPRS